MSNDFKYTESKPGTVFQCKGSAGEYLAAYTGSWQPIGQHVKLEVIKLVENQNHTAERINASEITGSIDRDKIFNIGDQVRVPFYTGTVQSFTEGEFVIVAIKAASTTKMPWPRLIGLNAEYAKQAVLSE